MIVAAAAVIISVAFATVVTCAVARILGVVDEAGENHQADEQSDEEHAETFQTGAEREQKNLQTDRMLGQLEDADETNDTEEGE